MHPSYVKQPEYSPSHSEYPPYKLPRVKKSQPLSWLGSPRQTESLYNYQPHHHHLTVVKDLMSVRYVGGEQTTLNRYLPAERKPVLHANLLFTVTQL